ncbi:hypothetical protein DAPPUDRAFT_100201 [Daphnia pulex]|uniref:Uncharacterized protein n=1 Tax=Daphnia pulex TaxID=6669 RepID=E9G9Q4_DAPPU|nr:hypothetical protein DAPPUDRAFT_100201 [Daphnia pulex]|eukprot:EFX83612.1 hypothetical protein DAPPUDRAFT_100201 [Daphnia pulex]
MYNLTEKGGKCSSSIKLWKKLKNLLSLSGEERWKYHEIRLVEVIAKTKWRIKDNHMFGVLEIANSNNFHPFIPDKWFINEKEKRCEFCGKYEHVKIVRKMTKIPTDVEAFVFPVARESAGTQTSTTTFPAIIKMVATAVGQKIISANFLKMPNTSGNGSAGAYDFTMTDACQKTKDAKDSTCGVYAVMPNLIHRIVYVYEIGIPIYVACSDPSAFIVLSYALVLVVFFRNSSLLFMKGKIMVGN